MSLSVSLNNSRAFGRETRVLIGGGILSGLIASVLGAAVGTASPLLPALTFGAILGLLANFSDLKAGTPMLRLIVSILGGVAWVILLPYHWALGAAVAGLFFGGAFSMDEKSLLSERALSWAMFSGALALAVFTTRGLFSQIGFSLMENVLSAATWGIFLSFASGLTRLEWNRNEILSSFKESYSEASGEERESIHAGRVLYEQILGELKRVDEKMGERARIIADETSQALLALTRRSGELKLAEERTKGRNLESRVFELDQKISKTRDKSVKKELEATLQEMVEQLRVRRRFGSARARLDARVQRCFTALERLHLSLVQIGTGDNDAVLEDSLGAMEKLSEEIRWRNLSVDELLGESSDEEHTLTSDSVVEEIREKRRESEEGTSKTVLDIQSRADEFEAHVDEADALTQAGQDGILEVKSQHDQSHQS